ncbi:MAG: cob(I)yrinic acid a,c-diamide adenosyltransferase [Planctomycetota bacterium]|jgi:cob(I)alamin adenosyltransferase
MTVYTRSGDDGETARPDGQRVRKSDVGIEALGTLDELNAHVGWCITAGGNDAITDMLRAVQEELMSVGSMLADGGKASDASLDADAVGRLEKQIDAAWAKLPPLDHFVVPGGTELAARLHVARTVCRRAERRTVAAVDDGLDVRGQALRYLNRLSDLLFALARQVNIDAGAGERVWKGQ